MFHFWNQSLFSVKYDVFQISVKGGGEGRIFAILLTFFQYYVLR
jgi:hypothetical protein